MKTLLLYIIFLLVNALVPVFPAFIKPPLPTSTGMYHVYTLYILGIYLLYHGAYLPVIVHTYHCIQNHCFQHSLRPAPQIKPISTVSAKLTSTVSRTAVDVISSALWIRPGFLHGMLVANMDPKWPKSTRKLNITKFGIIQRQVNNFMHRTRRS